MWTWSTNYRSAPNLDEVLAAAEMILGGSEEMADVKEIRPSKRTSRKRRGCGRQGKKKQQQLRRSKRRKMDTKKDEEGK